MPAMLQRKGDILAHRHMRIKGVGLEHHRQPALGGRHLGGVTAVDLDLAARHILQPRDQAQQGGLAAAGRADEDHELAVLDGQVQRRNDLHLAEFLLHIVECDASHAGLLI
jgi:hypothetical protein